MSDWSAWIDREEHREDRIERGHFNRWLASLDRVAPGDGSVPQGFHWALCLPDAPTAYLGLDGHLRRDCNPKSLLPPVELTRRMWAASAVEFHAPLLTGEAVSRVSRVASIKTKQGSAGPLVFIDLVHEVRGANGLAVSETQSIVYKAATVAGSSPSPPSLAEGRFDPNGWQVYRTVMPSEVLLFRFSALTFNSHRIHYDLAYATKGEGYRGLVVHGPLTASLLLDLAAREFGDNALRRFAFRGNSPAICGETLHLALRRVDRDVDLGVFAADGRQIMTASASL